MRNLTLTIWALHGERVKSRWCLSLRSAASASAQCQIATAMMMPYRVPFRVASAFLAGIVLHTLLHFAVHSGQLRSDCRHPGSGCYAAGPSLFPQPKTTRRGGTAASDRCLASRTLKSSRGPTKTPGSGRRTTVIVMGRQAIRATESLFEDSRAGSAPSGPLH